MATKNENMNKTGTTQQSKSVSGRIEDKVALREALHEAFMRVKRLARKEMESETAGEEILHFRLKSV